MVVIPMDILKTNDSEEYFKYFYLIKGDFSNHQEAYYHIETVRAHYGLNPKFSTYESFKTIKTRYDNEHKNR